MKRTILAIALLSFLGVAAAAQVDNPGQGHIPNNHGGNGGSGGNGGNGGNANNAVSLAATLNATQEQSNVQVQSATSLSGAKSTAGSAAAAEGGNVKGSGNSDVTIINTEAKQAAASAAALVVQVASNCGGTGGGSGQGFSGGGAFGFSFEFKDCKVMREAAFLISLGLEEAGLQHVARNIDRVGETLLAVYPGQFKIARSTKEAAPAPTTGSRK
jgi:hypothetical protein